MKGVVPKITVEMDESLVQDVKIHPVIGFRGTVPGVGVSQAGETQTVAIEVVQ